MAPTRGPAALLQVLAAVTIAVAACATTAPARADELASAARRAFCDARAFAEFVVDVTRADLRAEAVAVTESFDSVVKGGISSLAAAVSSGTCDACVADDFVLTSQLGPEPLGAGNPVLSAAFNRANATAAAAVRILRTLPTLEPAERDIVDAGLARFAGLIGETAGALATLKDGSDEHARSPASPLAASVSAPCSCVTAYGYALAYGLVTAIFNAIDAVVKTLGSLMSAFSIITTIFERVAGGETVDQGEELNNPGVMAIGGSAQASAGGLTLALRDLVASSIKLDSDIKCGYDLASRISSF